MTVYDEMRKNKEHVNQSTWQTNNITLHFELEASPSYSY